ncbi:transglutaminase family protein [Pseudonocardia yuanmonensis]|uniref:Transglutaminase family protein n=1 Tax=Pseudonocardia yuanmonensis TaxID=1095914 RepID=A0ABP8XF16_9PSEU
MRRDVTARLQLTVSEPALMALQIAVAGGASSERLTLTLDDTVLDPPRELDAGHGGRTHVLECAPGELVVEYVAAVEGRQEFPAAPLAEEMDRLVALRPSRYCPSDRLLATASREFGSVEGAEARIAAVTGWVRNRLSYVGGSSKPTDDAVDTLLLGEGVCRDYAHLVVTLLRALDVPARLVAVYAPGLFPMDFHAVVEAWTGSRWVVVDATGLAPRASMLRIHTGRDAADTAFLTTHHGVVELTSMQVMAVVDELPKEDPDAVVQLG